ncbi:MAG TPA: DUF6152 family protein [Bryobacteraceae bacterium]|jgi:hypothetical protein
MKQGFSVAIAGLVLLAAGVPLRAHHSTAATYDMSKVVTLKGVVTEVTWLNPHCTFSMNVKDGDGNTVHWTVELPPPNYLMRQGWKRSDLKQGDEVTVDVWLDKKGSNMADGRIVHMPDGRSIPLAAGW